MSTHLAGIPQSIKLADQFCQIYVQFSFQYGLFPCQTSNGCSEHMALVIQA